MKFGHRGLKSSRCGTHGRGAEITSHNHGFAVDQDGWRGGATSPRRRSAVSFSHWNLNDGTLEGMRCLDVPAISVQYHPEAAPGPHDSRYLFAEFRELMRA